MASSAKDKEAVAVLIEFAAAYVHQLLYTRGVYSRELFKRHRLYGTVAWKSRHPELNTYIAQATSSLQVAETRPAQQGARAAPARAVHA